MGISVLAAALTIAAAAGTGQSPANDTRSFPLLSDEESWRSLGSVVQGPRQPLPSWARALAGLVPRTTGAMLALDFAHRARSPLDPKLRAALRWVAASANHCAYSQAYAVFDAERAGAGRREIEDLRRGVVSGRSPAEQAALEFARKMTVDSAGITDAEFASLVHAYGERQTAAIVLHTGYANFQDRLLLCLDSPLEEGGPAPPPAVEFAPGALHSRPSDALAIPLFPFEPSSGKPQIEVDPEWATQSYEELEARLERQRQRPTRLRVPAWEEVERQLPRGLMRPNRVVWNLVHLGYEPGLGIAWETMMRANAPESNANLDRIFGVNLFWVTTRATNSAYCMGHTEMLWELGGLPRQRIVGVCRVLASNDWSSFPPAERRALAFARKVTKAPWSVSAGEFQELKRDFGAVRAAVIIWWECRSNYMTRVANAFQLNLERDNVLQEFLQRKTARAKREVLPARP
jgi:alkylhydroperoxidase family enzyme